jgi:hypothetical protein
MVARDTDSNKRNSTSTLPLLGLAASTLAIVRAQDVAGSTLFATANVVGDVQGEFKSIPSAVHC